MIRVKQKSFICKICLTLLILILVIMSCGVLTACAEEDILYDTDITIATSFNPSKGYTYEWQVDIFNNTDLDKENLELIIYFSHDNKIIQEECVIDKINSESWKSVRGEFVKDSYSVITIESVSYKINGAKFTAGEYNETTFNIGMVIFFGALIVMVIAININSKKNKETKNKRSLSMKHNECEVSSVGDSCLHIDVADSYDTKVCKYCGYHNEKKAKKCSVCGNRLPWF